MRRVPDLAYLLAIVASGLLLRWYVLAGLAGDPIALAASQIMAAALVLLCAIAASVEFATWLYLVQQGAVGDLPGRGLPLVSATVLAGFGIVYAAGLGGWIEIGPLTPYLFRFLLLVLVVVLALRGVMMLAIIMTDERYKADGR